MKKRPPKELVSPAPTDTIATLYPPEPQTVTVKFSWSEGIDVDEYWLEVGRTPGGKDLYDSSEGLELSTTVPAIPLGVEIYVRLWTRIEGKWFAIDYQYKFTVQVESPGGFTAARAGAILIPPTQVTIG